MTDQPPQVDDAWRYTALKAHIAKTLARLQAYPDQSEHMSGRVFELENMLAYVNGLESPPDQS